MKIRTLSKQMIYYHYYKDYCFYRIEDLDNYLLQNDTIYHFNEKRINLDSDKQDAIYY